MRIFVFDANCVVSAALKPRGVSREALAAAQLTGSIALSGSVFREIAEVLGRPKFAALIPTDVRRDILELLSASAIWVQPRVAVTDCRDPKDNCYLELALAAGASVIVSGDEDLRVLDPWRSIAIRSPSQLLTELQAR